MTIRKHVLITGTGRTGTSFLIELLTNLGLETGYKPENLKDYKFSIGRAGFEKDIRSKNCPYIVKNPSFCDYADEVLSRQDILIEHIFVPIRDLNAAAESRRFVTKTGIKRASVQNRIKYLLGITKTNFAGGLWKLNSLKRSNQELVLLTQLYKLMLAASNSNTALTLIRYPKLTSDPSYLFEKLQPILKAITFEEFLKVFDKTVQPELVNNFNEDDK